MLEMTYFGFLLRFLVVPLVILGGLVLYDRRQGRRSPEYLSAFPAWAAIGLHAVVAVIYTTPWDNYLVATGVWYYNPALVAGITLGWVPLEEYLFFVLQTTMAGWWLLLLARRLPLAPDGRPLRARLRLVAPLILGLPWLGAVIILASRWPPGTYLALELAWALPPISLQLVFGADILWRYRRLVGLALGSVVLYLSLTDSLAIGGGTWTISPQQSLGLLLGGVLPVEEIIFFSLTTTLVVLGLVLLLVQESRDRFRLILRRVPFVRAME